jgi:CHAT domain-containing protein
MQKVDKLTVRQVSASLKRAMIAYLLACSTAENRAGRLVDEVIHLASGVHVARFSHVIASMWSLDDRICVKVAKGFYERLKADCSLQKSDKAIAAALHDSVMEVRSKIAQNAAPLGALHSSRCMTPINTSSTLNHPADATSSALPNPEDLEKGSITPFRRQRFLWAKAIFRKPIQV